MHESHGVLLDAKTAGTTLALWGVLMLLHALWRSRGEAPPDPIRKSGPIL